MAESYIFHKKKKMTALELTAAILRFCEGYEYDVTQVPVFTADEWWDIFLDPALPRVPVMLSLAKSIKVGAIQILDLNSR